MHVIETVARTGETRMIDPLMADGIIRNAERQGYKIVRSWDAVSYSVSIFRPGAWRAMLNYAAPTN
jgi:hypothetical protein